MLTSVLIGNVLEITATFTEAGAAVDPDTVRVRLQPPGDASEIVLTPSSTAGSVTVTHQPSVPGGWRIRIETDSPDSAAEDTIVVTKSTFPTPH